MAFNEATRQNIRSAGSLAYTAGQTGSLPIPRVGYLARIHIYVEGNMNVVPGTGTATLSEKAPWSLFRRIRYEIGSGTTLFNTSGWGAYLVDLRSKLAYDPTYSPAFGSDTEVYDFDASAGDNDWRFGVTIPITPNERDIVGLILLQAEGTVTQLMLDWQNASGPTHDFPVVTTGDATATFTGRAKIYLETFTVPAAIEDQPPLDRIFQTFERVDAITNTGDNSIKLLEENTYVRLIHSVEVDGLLDGPAVESRQLRYNITDVPYELDRRMDLYLERRRYIRDMPYGVYAWEFFDQGYPNYGGDRDLVQATGLAELESIIRIAPDTVLGPNNNVIRTVQQQIVRVAAPPALAY